MKRRWLRVVLPGNWAGIFLVTYIGFQAVVWAVQGGIVPPDVPHDFLLVLAAVAYGAYRVGAFHPVLRPDYHDWLARTPWTPRHPLPVGPVHLVPQDMVVVGLLTLLGSRHPNLHPVVVPLIALVSYLAMLCLTLWLCRVYAVAYVLTFGLGLLVRFIPHMSRMWIVVAGLTLLSYVGLRQSLALFPWTRDWFDNQYWLAMSTESAMEKYRKDLLGWPFDRLEPRPAEHSVGYGPGILLSLLAGWWLYAVLAIIPRAEARIAVGEFFCVIVCMALVGTRLQLYIKGHASPMNFWGRVLTFRWIIPGYDQVYVAPLVTLFLASASASATIKFRLPGEFTAPATLTLMMLATLLIGPSLTRWRLTGNHRIHHGFPTQKFALAANSLEQRELVEL